MTRFQKILLVPLLLLSLVFPFAQTHAITCGFGSDIGGGVCRGYLTTTGAGTFTVPSDWNSANNTIETIGGGGSGGINTRNGGGGGGYSKISNLPLTPGASIDYSVGVGGTGETSDGVNGQDTWFNGASLAASSVGSKAGLGGGDGEVGLGGEQVGNTGGVGTVKNKGGTGGLALVANSGAGGGAAGLNGDGNSGGNEGGNGGTGDAGNTTPGGSAGAPPTAGTNGTQWDGTHGSGSGGGPSTSTSFVGGAGGSYGAGGGGTNRNAANAGGDGFQGLIAITYTPAAASSNFINSVITTFGFF
jgi:hypothetical protein